MHDTVNEVHANRMAKVRFSFATALVWLLVRQSCFFVHFFQRCPEGVFGFFDTYGAAWCFFCSCFCCYFAAVLLLRLLISCCCCFPLVFTALLLLLLLCCCLCCYSLACDVLCAAACNECFAAFATLLYCCCFCCSAAPYAALLLAISPKSINPPLCSCARAFPLHRLFEIEEELSTEIRHTALPLDRSAPDRPSPRVFSESIAFPLLVSLSFLSSLSCCLLAEFWSV